MNFIISVLLLFVLSFGAIAKPLSAKRDSILNGSDTYQRFIKHYTAVIKHGKWEWGFEYSDTIVPKNQTVVKESDFASQLLVTSPNDSYCIDAFSGWDDEAGRDVDMSVWLIDKKSRLSNQIFFSGPDGGISAVDWINNSQFIMLGHEIIVPDTLFDRSNPIVRMIMRWYDLKKQNYDCYFGPYLTYNRYSSVPDFSRNAVQLLKMKDKTKRIKTR
jgi:hypothetical protein